MLTRSFRLRIQAADSSAELFALDRTFTTVASSIGRLETTLPRGLYKLRLQLGMNTKEVHLALDGEASRLFAPSPQVSISASADVVDVHFGEIEFASPVPLRATSRTHESHFENATRISAHSTLELGSGGKLFIFSRAWSPPAEQGRFAGWNPLTGLALHDANGARLCHLSGSAESDTSGDPWAGCNLAVTPGSYRLRREGTTVLEMPLFVPEGWQLQVFLLASPNDSSESPSIDLGRAAVLLSRRPFDHADPAWRLTEQTRQRLSLRRSVVSVDELRQMLFVKFDSPMLGIYAAHLLLTDAATLDIALLREVVRNLRRLVGPNPDVEAIALYIDMPVEDWHVFRWPPMLATSWELIVPASARRPELVPSHSPAAWMAPRLWTSSGLWLTWNPVDDALVAKPNSLFREGLSPSEARVWQFWRAQAPRVEVHARPTKAKVAIETVVNDLSLPASVVTDAAISLARRLTTTKIPNDSFRDSYAASAVAMMLKGNAEVVSPDEVLVARIQRGDVDAFWSLIKRHERNVRQIIESIVHVRDKADDVARAVFVRAYQGFRTWQGDVKPSTWLSKVARDIALEWPRQTSQDLQRFYSIADAASSLEPLEPEISARTAAEFELSQVRGVEIAEDEAPSVAVDSPVRVVLLARHSAYQGTSPPWRSMHSRFSGRRMPDAGERKHFRAGFGRWLLESDSEEELYYETIEEDILDLPPEVTGRQVIYVALVSGNGGLLAGFSIDYRGPYHTIGFASKIRDRSLLLTLVLDDNIKCIHSSLLELSEAIDGIQHMTIPPIETTYEFDVEFKRNEE
jgi:DNA-directed RNA polymerase specialized sigma24 family protein